MFPTSVGVEPATSWSPVGQRIQLSHRGRHGNNVPVDGINGKTVPHNLLYWVKFSIKYVSELTMLHIVALAGNKQAATVQFKKYLFK